MKKNWDDLAESSSTRNHQRMKLVTGYRRPKILFYLIRAKTDYDSTGSDGDEQNYAPRVNPLRDKKKIIHMVEGQDFGQTFSLGARFC